MLTVTSVSWERQFCATCKLYVGIVVIDKSMDDKSCIEGNSPLERYI